MASVLSECGVTEVLTADGATAPVDTLSGKVLGIYFSAHWCPPCRGFTPKLSAWFTKFKKENANKDNFELVFVSSDKDEAAFKDYLSEMSFGAVPFENRDAKAKLSSKFKVNGIPTLVIVGADGEMLTDQGRRIVAEDPEGLKYPWRPPPLNEVIGDVFVDHEGNEVRRESFKDKTIGIYYSAHWCGPCKSFTPQLVKLYNKLKEQGKPFEILFASQDRSPEAFKSYFAEMPWLAFPYQDKRARELATHFGMQGIPSLYIISPEGQILNKNGRSAVMADPDGADFPWALKPLSQLSEMNIDLVNEKACLMYFAEDDDEAAKAEAALKPIADAADASAKEQGKKELDLIYLVGTGDDVAETVQRFTKAGDKKVVLLDIPEQTKYLYESDDLSTEALSAWIAKFVNGELQGTSLR